MLPRSYKGSGTSSSSHRGYFQGWTVGPAGWKRIIFLTGSFNSIYHSTERLLPRAPGAGGCGSAPLPAHRGSQRRQSSCTRRPVSITGKETIREPKYQLWPLSFKRNSKHCFCPTLGPSPASSAIQQENRALARAWQIPPFLPKNHVMMS